MESVRIAEKDPNVSEYRSGWTADIATGKARRAAGCPLQTFGARFVVEPLENDGEEKRSHGGIVIPQTANAETHAEGVVVSVGDGLLLQDGTVKALPLELGDQVLYRKHAGAVVKVEGREFVILDLENLLAVKR